MNWHHADPWADSPFVLSHLPTQDLCSLICSFFCIINFPLYYTSLPSAYKHNLFYLILKALNLTFPLFSSCLISLCFTPKLLKSLYLYTLSPCCHIPFSPQPTPIRSVSSTLHWRLMSSASVFLQLMGQFRFPLTEPKQHLTQADILLSFDTFLAWLWITTSSTFPPTSAGPLRLGLSSS